jgi:hypothetical protein
LTDSKKIKAELDQYPDVQALLCSRKNLYKIKEIFRYISICYFNGNSVWTTKILQNFCTHSIKPEDRKLPKERTFEIYRATRRLGSTKDLSEKIAYRVGNRFVLAALEWLKEKGYITTQKEGHKTFWIPSDNDKSMTMAFVFSLDQETIDILKVDLSDIFTRLDVPSFLVSTLKECNETFKKDFIEKVRKYPLVKEAILKRMDEQITVYEGEIKKFRDLKSLF